MQDLREELLKEIKDAEQVLAMMAVNVPNVGMAGKMACVDASEKFLPMLYELLQNDNIEYKDADCDIEVSMTRRGCLESAMECVCKSREQEYGAPEDSFSCIARYWSAHLGVAVSAHNVAIMMALLKIARTDTGRGNYDSYVDAAGYMACAVELRNKQS